MIRSSTRLWLRLLMGMVTLFHLTHLDAVLGLMLVLTALASLTAGRVLSGATLRLAPVVLGLAIAAAVLSRADWMSGAAIATFIAAAGWLKLLELNRSRDAVFVWICGFWLLGMMPLWLAPGTALLLLPPCLALTLWSLAEIGPGARIKPVLKTLALAAPITALLFAFTPRITGHLGVLSFALGIPLIIETEAEKKRDPMQDGLTMGDIAQRANDTTTRVLVASFLGGSGIFHNGPPPLGDLYWRGPVLWTYEAGAWRGREGWEKRSNRMRGKITHATLDAEMRETGKISAYDMMMFPHRGYWLYALDFPAAVPASTFITRDYQLQNLNPVRELLNFPMMAFLDYRAGIELDPETRAMALQLPADEDPRTQELGRGLRERHGDPVAIARAGLALFDESYRYDKKYGGLPGENPTDSFLFDVRDGYSSQFATAYTLIMRAAGIPARLVVGYRGGVHLGLTNRVYVMENDAHAWSEIWLDAYGWVRMDPSVPFTRRGTGQEADGWGLAGALGAQPKAAPVGAGEGIETADAAEIEQAAAQRQAPQMPPGPERSWWETWITDFDATRQMKMLDAASFSADWKGLLLLGALAGAFLTLALLAIGPLQRHWRVRRMPLLQRYEYEIGRWFAAQGIRRAPTEGLGAFFERALAMRADPGPAMAQQTRDIRRLGAELRAALFAGKPLARDWSARWNAARRAAQPERAEET